MRPDGRRPDELRPLVFRRRWTRQAPGSVLVRMGRTTVLCTCCVEAAVPPFLVGRASIRVGVSMGGSRGIPGELTAEQLVKDADLALRVAKAGKARWEWYAPGMTVPATASDAA